MPRISNIFRKIIVASIGLPLLVLGIILIPLPGPGVLVCLLAFFILSLEFEWARKYFDKFKNQIMKILDDARRRIEDSTKEPKK
jgi:uncharacterized protein (TIGR02611 family)